MQTIDIFWYKNILEVQVQDPAIFTTRNRIVYSRPIKIYQGIDNPIHIVAKNQDQKPVDFTGYVMTIEIQDPENEITVASYSVNFVTITKGLGTFVIPRDTVNALDQRHYQLTARLINSATNAENPLYIDDNYSVAVPLQVLSAYYSTDPVSPTLAEGIVDLGPL
jgi:hypothetical protein